MKRWHLAAIVLIVPAVFVWYARSRQAPAAENHQAPEEPAAKPAEPQDPVSPLELRPIEEPPETRPGLVCSASDGRRSAVLVVATPHFSLRGGESLHPALDARFEAAWRGLLLIKRAGVYRFACEGRLLLNGEPARGRAVTLEPGAYALELTYRRANGAARLQLRWSGESFPEEPLPGTALGHPADDEEARKAHLLERGVRLAWERNCVRCHRAQSAMLPPPRMGPDLSLAGERLKAAWIYEYLAQPRHYRAQALMPELPLSAEERLDLTAYLTQLKRARPTEAPRWRFAYREATAMALWNTVGCTACHGTNNLSISGVGSKLNAEALQAFLLDPSASGPWGCPDMFYLNESEQRLYEYIQMVDSAGRMNEKVLLNPMKRLHEETYQLARVLSQSRKADFERPVSGGDAAQGERLIATKGCLACHALEPPSHVRQALPGQNLPEGAVQASPWQTIGPFPSGGEHRRVFGPETDADPRSQHDRGDGQTMAWEDGSSYADGAVHTLCGNQANAVLYFQRTLETGAELAGTLEVGSDDTISVWLNGKQIFESLLPRGMPKEKDQVPIRLRKGANRLLIKVGNLGGDFQFYFRLGPCVPPLANAYAAPALRAEARGCLAEPPPAGAPRFGFTKEDREALLAFLGHAAETPERTPAPLVELARGIERLACAGCHALDQGLPAANGLESPPTLAGAGSKLRAEWLQEVLLGRKRIRPWLKLRMPRYRPEAVGGLPQAFHAASGDSDDPAAASEATSAEELKQGAELLGIGENRLGCVQCHDFRERAGAGTRGPDLATIHERIRPAWFARWMHQPQRIQPGTSMPTFFDRVPPEEADRQIAALWKTLAMGKGLPLPPGIDAGARHVLEVKDRPLVVRGYLPDCSARGIAVGMPGYLSYCFDAESCHVRYAWFGAFLDITRTHTGMGSGPPEVLGRRCYTGPAAQPLRLGDRSNAPAVAFKGYELADSGPVFRFLLDGAEASLRVTSAGGEQLVLSYEIAAANRPVWFVTGGKDPGGCRSAEGAWDGGDLSLPAAATVRFSIMVGGERKP